jgi:hypothetical protein
MRKVALWGLVLFASLGMSPGLFPSAAARSAFTSRTRDLGRDAVLMAGPASPAGIERAPSCRGNDGDTAIVQNAFAEAAHGRTVYLPAGICDFDRPIIIPHPTRLAVIGAGPYQTVLQYTGANANTDLITLGNRFTQSANLFLSRFRIASNTRMAGGAALHLINVVRSVLANLTPDGQDGNGNLHHGVWFDQVDDVHYDGIDARAQGDCVRIDGGIPGRSPNADLWLGAGKIGGCGIGVHVGGGFGGLYVTTTDIIANRTNVLVDNAINGLADLQLFLEPSAIVDSALDNGVLINETVPPQQGQIHLLGWVASSGANNIYIQRCHSCKIDISGNMITGARNDGIRIDDGTVVANIRGEISGNGLSSGYGVHCTVPVGIYFNTTIHDNKGGNISAKCGSANINAFTSQPSNPRGTTSSSAVMMGLAGAITPRYSGVVDIKVCGDVRNSKMGGEAGIQLRVGFGQAPVNGAAAEGTSEGPTLYYAGAASGRQQVPYCMGWIASNLRVGTTYWLDLGLLARGGGTANLFDTQMVAYELH